MPARPTPVKRLLTTLSLALPLLAVAQISPAALTSAEERAQREAERVFSVIKFHTIRSKPADAGASKPRPPAKPVARTDRPAPAAAATPAAEPVTPSPALAETVAPKPQAAEPAPGTWQAPPAVAATREEPVSAVPSTPAEQDSGDDDPDEAPLRMQHFVAPVFPPAVQATLGAGSRNVRVRFTVRPDGTVVEAEAAAGVPRRLARPATEAILQWQFAPLPQARTADVDIEFRRD